MGRTAVRDLKQAMRAGVRPQASPQESKLGGAAALALLERSIRWRHDRLAILRLAAAIRLGACVTTEQWQYCEQAMARVGDEALYERVIEAMRQRQIDDTGHAA